MSCAKTDEPIEIPFGVWTNVSPLNHVLDEGPDSRRGRVNCRDVPCDAVFRQYSLTTWCFFFVWIF